MPFGWLPFATGMRVWWNVIFHQIFNLKLYLLMKSIKIFFLPIIILILTSMSSSSSSSSYSYGYSGKSYVNFFVPLIAFTAFISLSVLLVDALVLIQSSRCSFPGSVCFCSNNFSVLFINDGGVPSVDTFTVTFAGFDFVLL